MMIDDDMRRVIEEQRLAFVATVCPDGSPNLSPKGTIAVWEEEHLVFLHLYSHGTVSNLEQNSSIELNVVDPIRRKGYRFKGKAQILKSGSTYNKIVEHFKQSRGTDPSRIKAVVLVKVLQSASLISPAYDDMSSEEEIARRWKQHYDELLGY
ncbi:pyridoxamine 5'-phosphate oxidase family protein [Ornithinibacillus bavariensis]|uniref:Pyridoxamine 5'-phosphate oxidase n=1 Tax=Ornithinibacillus bavariensis TaxID=545502 RepID=A0A920C480_9BACI|nr:pyridoxamine 5'-phosphate oxidase family protein [Ornithinibacillus bavariensis]GIO25421.1 pyridoxamine 5'-phosphate oxidase [Ornithinibacillus bavariensis]HAM80524.1 flavin-nucleotide-binding protein [Ornithinibacillus sp.]